MPPADEDVGRIAPNRDRLDHRVGARVEPRHRPVESVHDPHVAPSDRDRGRTVADPNRVENAPRRGSTRTTVSAFTSETQSDPNPATRSVGADRSATSAVSFPSEERNARPLPVNGRKLDPLPAVMSRSNDRRGRRESDDNERGASTTAAYARCVPADQPVRSGGGDVLRLAAHGRRWELQRRVLPEDRVLELAQLGARVERELLDKQRTRRAERRQRLGLTAGSIEREHLLRAQPLTQGMLRDQRLQLWHE